MQNWSLFLLLREDADTDFKLAWYVFSKHAFNLSDLLRCELHNAMSHTVFQRLPADHIKHGLVMFWRNVQFKLHKFVSVVRREKTFDT